MTKELINNIILSLSQLEEDETLSKNVRLKLKSAISALQGDKTIPVKVNKTLQELDELSENPNVPQYTRTQIWNIVSSLERI